MKKFIFIIASTTILAVAACTPKEATRGNFLHDEDAVLIQPMTTTKSDVLAILGTPTTKAVFDDNTWYYVGLKTQQTSFMDAEVTERKIFQINFDDNDFVTNFKEITDDPVNVPIASRTTPTSGHNLTLLQQILGNVGKFSAPQQ